MNDRSRRSWLPPALAAALAVAAAGCSARGPHVREFTVDNASGRIEVASAERDRLAAAAGLARATVNKTLASLDPERYASDIAKLNRVGGTVRLQVSYNTFRLIDLARHYCGLTGGAYDFTLSPLEEIWGFRGLAPAEPPSDELIEAARAGVGWKHVEVQGQGAVALTTPTTRIDVGTLALSYAVDLSILDLRRRSQPNVLLRVGNSLRCLGEAEPGQSWTAAIPHPFNAATNLGTVSLDGPSAMVLVQPGASVIRIGNRTYPRIIDPRSGRPAEGTALVAARGPTATQAHVLAYALAVLGLEEGVRILPNFERYDVLLVPDRRPLEVWATQGFADRFRVEPSLARNLRTIERAPPPAAEADAVETEAE